MAALLAVTGCNSSGGTGGGGGGGSGGGDPSSSSALSVGGSPGGGASTFPAAMAAANALNQSAQYQLGTGDVQALQDQGILQEGDQAALGALTQ